MMIIILVLNNLIYFMEMISMATYQKWDQSYNDKVTTIRLSYRGVKYNKVCASPQSVYYSPH